MITDHKHLDMTEESQSAVSVKSRSHFLTSSEKTTVKQSAIFYCKVHEEHTA